MAARTAVTLKVLAEELGLNVSTVSRMSNDPEGLTPGWAAQGTEEQLFALAEKRWDLADFADATLRDGGCRVRITATVAGWVTRSATGQGVVVAMTDATAARARSSLSSRLLT